jgi:tRNA (cytidine/uridine-2'-O-)-methyltransferase
MRIVLYEPEIPANTGNIARLSVAAGCELHLIRPLGFSLSDRYLKRAGLDYWPHVRLSVHDSIDELYLEYSDSRYIYFSTKADKLYTEVRYTDDDFLVFGPESRGLPQEILDKNPDNIFKVPMWGEVRSINLSSAVAIVTYEAQRQVRGF